MMTKDEQIQQLEDKAATLTAEVNRLNLKIKKLEAKIAEENIHKGTVIRVARNPDENQDDNWRDQDE
jgi:cell division protein FtsB